MPNLATATVCGHLGRDPESFTAGDATGCRMSVAYTRKRKGVETTTWFRVTAWRQSAEYALKYLHKGDAVLVSGDVHLEEYEKDGAKRQSLCLEADRVVSLASKRGDGDPSRDPVATAAKIAAHQASLDDSSIHF